MDHFALAERLQHAGQEHLLVGIDDYTEAGREALLAQLAEVDWQELRQDPPHPPDHATVRPPRVVTLVERRQRQQELHVAGEAVYTAGRAAVLMVAGGQGTRLGFEGPKGCYELGAHSGKSIYQLQAEKVVALSSRLGRAVPLLVMTSPATDAETRTFFAAHDQFGLKADQVRFFAQGTVPSLDRDGRALLNEQGLLLTNPDGHGGCFSALVASGQLRRLREEGIRHLVYIQVDNILAPVDDSMLLGVAVQEQADVVTKVLAKAHPDEKVGHLVTLGQRDLIVEYTELTPEQTRLRGADGEFIWRWGSPAMHCWSVAFLARLADAGYKIPLHRSAKPLKALVAGQPATVQGWKLERFIFDLIPEALRSVGLELDRAEEFAPVKNASGADSPDSARTLASACYARWLSAAGVAVNLPPGTLIEVSPLFAATADGFAARWKEKPCLERVTGDYYLEG